MAVKARNEVTVVDLTDVQAVTIYYLLQASTLAAPSAPTIKKPTNWSTTEPAFDNTTTKTLYTCVRTLYKNGTFNWGDVSVSSSYEAAKNAYNAAQAAQNTADGKNTVYRQSSQPSGGTYKSGDVWFDTANGNSIYTYSGSSWVKNEMGSAAIAANAIVAGLIASNAITTDKLAANAVSTTKLATDAIKSLNYVAESAGMFLNLADGSIDAPNFKVDSSGNVTIKNGGITIKNNNGTDVFLTDSNGNLEITGALRMSGSQTVRIDNASGVLVGQLLFEALSGVTWSPGALKVRGYDYLTLEAGADTSITKAYGRIMARGFGLAMLGSEDYGSSGNQSFFCFGQNGTLLGVKVVSTSNSYSETMTFRTKQFPQIIFGSYVYSASNTNAIAMFDNSTLNTLLGTSGVNNFNTVVVVGNGDGGACNAHCQDCTYLNGIWHTTFDRVFTGNIRVNYAVITYA